MAILGIDLGGTYIKAVVASSDGRVHHRLMEPSAVADGPESTIETLIDIARSIEVAHSFDAIGLGICGPVDHTAGLLVESPILPGWSNVPVVDAIQEKIEMPVHLENDASCAMLGEWWLGAGERKSIIAGLTLGTGIGGGLVLDGTIFRGATGWGAEFGHISLAPEPPCPCGGHGCLNQLASVTATLARYRELAGDDIENFEELLGRSQSGDAHATNALATSVAYLVRAIRSLVNVLNPDVFVLAGGMAQWGDSLVEAVQRSLAGTTFSGPDRTPIRSARLGLFSGALGAARLAHVASASPTGNARHR